MPAPTLRTSFLAHEPAVGSRRGAAHVAGGAGYAVAEQARALRAHVARHGVPGASADVVLLCPAAPHPTVAAHGVPTTTFDPPPGSLDEIARLLVEDPAWRRRLARHLGDAPTLAHHLPAAALTIALGLPTLCALHSLWPSVQAALPGGAAGPRADACAVILEQAAAILVATSAERTWLLRTAPPAALARDLASRVHVVPQAPSPFLTRLAARPDGGRRRAAWRRRLLPQVRPDDVVLYMVGRFVPYKRPLEVIEAFVRVAHRVRRAHLLLVGAATDRAYATRCADAVAAAPPSVRRRITLVGPQPLEAAPLAGDVLVHTSRYESWGRAIDEALVLGRPAVLAASPFVAERVDRPWPAGARDAEDPEDRALWIDPDDAQALGAALVRAADDAAWRKACGAFHHRRARERDSDGPARRVLDLWNDVEFAQRGTRPFALAPAGRGSPCAWT